MLSAWNATSAAIRGVHGALMESASLQDQSTSSLKLGAEPRTRSCSSQWLVSEVVRPSLDHLWPPWSCLIKSALSNEAAERLIAIVSQGHRQNQKYAVRSDDLAY